MNDDVTYDKRTRRLIGQVVFSILLLSMGYRYLSSVWLHQLESPVFRYPYVDLLYWGFHGLKIPDFLTGHPTAAAIFDLALLGSMLGSIYNVNWRIFPVLFSGLFLIYFLSFNSYGLHHTHCMVGGLLIGVPFWFRNDKTFTLLWEGLRYYTLWIYFSAFLWKLCRGSLFSQTHAEAIIKETNAGYLAMNPDGALAEMLHYLISHPELTFALFFTGFLIQSSFVIGFFTRKLDWLWFMLPFVFHLSTYFLLEVVFFEILVLNTVFLPWEKIAKKINPRFSNFQIAQNL